MSGLRVAGRGRKARRTFRHGAGNGLETGRQIRFTFDGKSYLGHPGDTLASALLANGVRLLGRSFKYHRPRGLLSAGPEEPNALVELRQGAAREPNTRATVAEIFDGLVASSQNRWPGLALDVLGINGFFSPVFTAGFYYKTFMWPASFWEKVYEPLIRRAAGLGRAADAADPDRYEKITAFCDVLVVGAGPAGLSAALAAAESGVQVILCEQDALLGGRLRGERTLIDGRPGWMWAQDAHRRLAGMTNVRIMTRSCVFARYDGGTYGVLERVSDHLPAPREGQPRQRMWRVVAEHCVVATGGIERPIVFPNNDRPGIMLAASVRTYLHRFGVIPGHRAVVYTNNSDGLRTVADLHHAGVRVVAIVEAGTSTAAQDLARQTGAALFSGATIANTFGRLGVTAAVIRDAHGREHRVGCDLIAVSGGWSPDIALTTHQGAQPVYRDDLAAFVPAQGVGGSDLHVVGVAAGVMTDRGAFESGLRAGYLASGTVSGAVSGADGSGKMRLSGVNDAAYDITPVWQGPGTGNLPRAGKAFVDFQNDVTARDIRLAAQEGFQSVEHLKRYTTLGMATDQGKTANVNALAMLADITGRSVSETGTTLIRPPVQPVALGALAGAHRGRHFKPFRLPPTHRWAEEQGAVFAENGLWLRAQWYPRPGETHWLETVNREVETVRNRVGFCDVSTLGKIDLQGPDVRVFLDRLYVNGWQKLPVGRARYGLMLREDGFVFDDGTTARLGENHYVMTTTTAKAASVMQHLEFCHQCLWPELDVQFISVTDEWAQIAVAGPNSRDVMRQIVDPDFDLSNAAFGFMAAAGVTVCGGLRARLFRLSFSGELAYEIAVPARYGDALARRLMQAGAPYGIAPYGTEALGVMRIEKGHPAGAELNGQTTAHDLGMGRLLSGRKDFIGRRMADRAALRDSARPTLVGLKPLRADAPLVCGAHLLPKGAAATAASDQGWIASSAWSPTVGAWIGLGFLQNGPARLGDVVAVHNPLAGTVAEAVVVSPVFVDPQGARLHG
ncbi:sarcosine oxidase subunit alpha family protein [Gluconobacter albidus]|uniref:sarcosine oxidase subunit alpha family protein n=1 Tax=Gluconobacter albidus TaxID=318683 RepID=UPI00209E6861|nr:sarcosine oxidase subunit alpha family protein [Gluconobacter albidus]MCP1274323.1 sarcosine oxidase subunit alpha family protein [Gluconobacter albidus]